MGCAKCRLTTGAQIAGSQINAPLVSSTFNVTNKKGLFSFFFSCPLPLLVVSLPRDRSQRETSNLCSTTSSAFSFSGLVPRVCLSPYRVISCLSEQELPRDCSRANRRWRWREVIPPSAVRNGARRFEIERVVECFSPPSEAFTPQAARKTKWTL